MRKLRELVCEVLCLNKPANPACRNYFLKEVRLSRGGEDENA